MKKGGPQSPRKSPGTAGPARAPAGPARQSRAPSRSGTPANPRSPAAPHRGAPLRNGTAPRGAPPRNGAGPANGAARNGHAANGAARNGHAANGAAPNGHNGHATHGGRPVREVVLSGPRRRSRLGAPRTAPVGDAKPLSFDEASAAGPEIQRLYRWAPRCRTCGQPMRGIVEVTAPAEGPNRHSFTMAVSAVLCPSCRTDNFLGAFTSWLVVSGPLPVGNANG